MSDFLYFEQCGFLHQRPLPKENTKNRHLNLTGLEVKIAKEHAEIF